MREIYLLPFIAGNLVLELPENATRGNCHFCPSTTTNGNTLHFLTRMREGYMGKRIVRFIFEIKCPLGGCKQRVIDAMRAVAGALGPELKVVAVHLGDDKDIHGTPTMQGLNDVSNCLLGVNLGSSRPDSPISTRRTYKNFLTEEQLGRSTALHFYSAEKGGIPDVIFGVVTLCFLEHNKNSFSVQGKESGTWPGWMAVIFVRDEDAKDLEYDKPLPPIQLLTRGTRKNLKPFVLDVKVMNEFPS